MGNKEIGIQAEINTKVSDVRLDLKIMTEKIKKKNCLHRHSLSPIEMW